MTRVTVSHISLYRPNPELTKSDTPTVTVDIPTGYVGRFLISIQAEW